MKMTYPRNWVKEIRPRVLARDNNTCQKCGAKEKLHVCHLDHNPESSDETRLLTMCRTCHTIYDYQTHPVKKCQTIETDEGIKTVASVIRSVFASEEELYYPCFPCFRSKDWTNSIERKAAAWLILQIQKSIKKNGLQLDLFPATQLS